MNTLSQSLAQIRKSYESAALDEAQSHANPFQQFEQWLGEAFKAEVPEPNAMTLATVGSDLRPSTRVVLIKDFDERGIQWFTNYHSRKGQELAGNPYAALQFHWVEMERVVRIEGLVERVDANTSTTYFNKRPLLSRIAAIASPQSMRVASRDALQALMDEASKASDASGGAPERPTHWGGYRLVPDRFEFWQGRRNRLHDRLHYELQAGGQGAGNRAQVTGDGHGITWIRSRLAP